MSMRVAVVVTHLDQGWCDQSLVVRRMCGALACRAEVDLLVADGATPRVGADGAVQVLGFSADQATPVRHLALRRALLGPQSGDPAISCACTAAMQRQRAAALPRVAQEALLMAAGGYSPELFRHLAATSYDIVVFCGCDTASTYWGMDAIGGRRPCVLLPAAAGDPALWNPAVLEVLDEADRIVVTTSFEADVVRLLDPELKSDQVWPLGFVIQVNLLASRSPAVDPLGPPTLVVARDWTKDVPVDSLVAWCDALVRDLGPRLKVRLAGPGAQRLPRRLRAEYAGSRSDLWRWMANALAVIDPEPNRLLGREVLESMLFATPVIVPAVGGASRMHADSGNGGLWYQTYEELRACVEAVLEPEVQAALGDQGRTYASSTYGDTDSFVGRVGDAVLALA